MTTDENAERGAVSSTAVLDALDRFLRHKGEDFLYWHRGAIVISTYHDKQFRELGGDTDRLISCFEDYCNMEEAADHYIASLRSASNGGDELPRADAGKNGGK